MCFYTVKSLNNDSGTFAHRAVCRSQSYKFLPRFYQSGKGSRLPQEKSRAPNRFGALLHATLMRQVLRTGKQAQTAEASCTCTCTSSSCCCGSSSCTPFLKFRSAPGWLQCLQYTLLLRECQHFPCTFMQERCNFDKLHKPTGLAGYGLAKFLQICYTICYSHTT